MDPIDAHVHVYQTSPVLRTFLEKYRLHFLDIAVLDQADPLFRELQPQLDAIRKLAQDDPGRTSLCTTFSPYDFADPGFANRVIRQLDSDFAQGAVAVKFYKTVGMQIRKPDGSYLMPDDPVFQPVFNDIAAHHITLVAHLAEPTSCWQAPNPASPDYDYYKEHPGEYAYLHPGWPSKESILAARDHLLENNPHLRVVGAHLGSMELDVDEVARRFDRYDNFAVDTAARVPYLMLQPGEKVRAFLIKYQDRVLYATDFGLQPDADTGKTLAGLRYAYAGEWRYFSTRDHFTYAGRQVNGLGLPADVLHKLYHDNAVRWFPAMKVSGPAAPSAR
jgi:predicted TIM-barrel fold metal-dependent hydrolase